MSEEKDMIIQSLTERLNKCNKAYKQLKLDYDNLKDSLNHPTIPIEEDEPSGDIDSEENVRSIFYAYPKQYDEQRSKQSIASALRRIKQKDLGFNFLLSKTKEFAEVLKRFGISNTHEKWNVVPSAMTWYDQDRYNLAPADWSAPFRKGAYVEPEKPKEIPKEPEQWRSIIKYVYPTSRPEEYTWRAFYLNHKDVFQSISDYYIKDSEGNYSLKKSK